MAAAIAHELNQPLTAIVNSLGAAKRLLQHGTFIGIGPALEVMDEAVQQSLRAGQVVGRLRNFLIRGDTETRVEDVATMVDEATTLALIGPSASGVRMRVRLDPEASHVVGNRIEIQQVLINLMRNSLEAMVGADRRELDLTTTLRRPDLVEFAVADSGPGIDPDVADRIFEAFVTTKRSGMGMGLSICRSIISRTAAASSSNRTPKGEPSFASLSRRSCLRGISMSAERTIHVVDDDAAVRLWLEATPGIDGIRHRFLYDPGHLSARVGESFRRLRAYWNKKREFEGFWLAIIKRIDHDEFTLEWFESPGEPAFKSRPRDIAVLHPEFRLSGK